MKKKIKLSIFFTVIFGLFLVACQSSNSSKEKKELPAIQPDTVLLQSQLLYGIPIDSFRVEVKKVRQNETFSDIFSQNNIRASLLDSLVALSDTVFDMRKIQVGHAYTIYRKDSIVKALVYEITPLDYYRIFFGDSLRVNRFEIQKRIDTVIAKGEIKSSLWNATVEANISPQIAIELSEVYAWSIDFFGLQKGDKFVVKYQRIFADTTYLGVGKIIDALFLHEGVSYYAFYYRQDSAWAYFDEKGNSLQKQFLKAPLRYSRISSRFSNHRYHPVLKIYRPHHGVDYAAPTGTPVHSIGDGKVIKKGYGRGGGNFVKIKHNSVYTTTYMHLSRFAKGLKVGKHVTQGELIGYVGQTGLATGPHLDFRVYRNGQAINPLKLKSPPTKPIKNTEREAYFKYITPLKTELLNVLKQ
jgi:murein DD-endopeptidase MepM/ murein hydrolase activator NlpD